MQVKAEYDVVILGAGHNGLVAAAYLARAGLTVLVLEKNNYIGGATTSHKLFPDYDARLSRYSYLVSLLPQKIIDDLQLTLELRQRTIASYTPYLRNGTQNGLLLSNIDDERSARSMLELTGSSHEYEQMKRFYKFPRVFAEHTWDSMLQPLRSREAMKQRFQADALSREAWRSLVEEPIGVAIERYLKDDLVRGLVLTDAKIGVFTRANDPSLLQNRCFLYHTIGNKTGEWKVPVGGMGAVAKELEQAARLGGTEIVTNATVLSLDSAEPSATFELDGKSQSVRARFLLVNFGRHLLHKLTGTTYIPDRTDEGSVFKVNMLLRKLPRLKASSISATEAFSGTFHSDEGYAQMKLSYREAVENRLPRNTPCEIYCHTITDDTILSPELRKEGYHTLTLFGLDAPYSLFAKNNEELRREAERRYLASINQWLEEPLDDCLAIARDGSPCLESKTPIDIEDSLGMYHGNIFHDAVTFPFAANEEQVGTWGVETEWRNVFICGSSAVRGGAVSGIPGHNAAMKVLSLLKH